MTPAARTDGSHTRLSGVSTAVRARCAILIAGAFAVVLAGVRSELFDLDRYALTKELVLHITALLSATTLVRRWRRLAPGVIDVLLLAFIVWSGWSALLAENHWLALRAFGVTVSSFVILLTARAVAREGMASSLLAGLASAAALGAMLGAGQAYGIEIPLLATERPPGATFGNRNFLAHLLVLALPAILVSGIRAQRRLWYFFAMMAVLVVAGAIILTRSRAAWLALATQLATFTAAGFLLSRGMRRERPDANALRPREPDRVASDRTAGEFILNARTGVAALVLALGATLAVVLPNSLQWRSDSPYAETLVRLADYREGSGRGRLIQYRNTLELVREDPVLGVGPGNWMVAYPRVTTPGDPSYAGSEPIPTNPWPSSDWMAYLSERGVIGTSLLLFAGIACALTAIRRILLLRPISAALDGIVALATLIGAAVTGMFDAVLLLAAPSLFLWAILGATLPATAPLRQRELSRRQQRVASAAVISLLAVFTIDSAGGVAAIVIAGNGRERTKVERALRYDPGNHRLHLVLSRRGPCSSRVPHAQAARALLPEHPAPREALRACGVTETSGE